MAQLAYNKPAVEVKLSAEDVRELDEASIPAGEYPYDFIARQQRW